MFFGSVWFIFYLKGKNEISGIMISFLFWLSDKIQSWPGDPPLRTAGRHSEELLLWREERPAVGGGGGQQAGAVEIGVGAHGVVCQAKVSQTAHQQTCLLQSGNIQVKYPQVFVPLERDSLKSEGSPTQTLSYNKIG